MKFPKISHILSEGSVCRLQLDYAVIKNGRIQAVNRHSGVYLNALDYMTEDQLKHCEGYAFHIDLIKLMEDADDVEFRPDSVNIKSGDPTTPDGMTTSPYKYSGQLKNDGGIDLYDEMFDDYSDPSGMFFEGLENLLRNIVTPSGDIDVKKWEGRSTYFKGVMLSYECLTKIVEPLIQEGDTLYLDFYHATDSDKVERPSQPIIITKRSTITPDTSIVFMMPSLKQ